MATTTPKTPKTTKSEKRTAKPKTAKPKVRSTVLQTELDSLRKETAALRESLKESAEKMGKLLEENANFRIKADAMLGQILKGLYLIGIDPDTIQRKCAQMFRKAVSAD